MTIHEYAPAFSVLPNGICLYNYYLGDRKRFNDIPKSNVHSSIVLSKKQSARIKKYINWLYLLSPSKSVYQRSTNKWFKFRVNFITLTLSSKQEHTDHEIKKILLDPFLRSLRRNNPQLLYVWKAEVQDNGNLHFHINTNIFIDMHKLQKLWNKYQDKIGYIDHERNSNPPSTRVKSVRNDKGLGMYMAGYIAKKDLYKEPLKRYFKRYGKILKEKKVFCNIPNNYFDNIKRKVTIKLWDCSSILKKVRISKFAHSLELERAIYGIIKDKECLVGDYFEYYSGVSWFNMKSNKMQDYVFKELSEIRKYVADMPMKYELD